MWLLDWWLRRDPKIEAERVPEALIEKATEYVVKIANPQLIFCSNYRERLAPGLTAAIGYVREVARQLPAARDASEHGWGQDASLRAYFASLEALTRTLSQAEVAQAYFAEQPHAEETYALVGMVYARQNVLGLALRGEIVEHDVLQETVSFSEHRVWLCSASEMTLRRKAAKRLFEQIGVVVRDHLATARNRLQQLKDDRAMLLAQAQHLRRGTDTNHRREVEALLEENTRALSEAGDGGMTLDRELDTLCALLQKPGETIAVSPQRLSLDATNTVVDAGAAADVTFSLALIPGQTPQERAFIPLRFPRTHFKPQGLRFDEAARLLI